MYLSSRLWAVYRTLRNCRDLSRKWLIANHDTAQRAIAFALLRFITWLAKCQKRANKTKVLPSLRIPNSGFGQIN